MGIVFQMSLWPFGNYEIRYIENVNFQYDMKSVVCFSHLLLSFLHNSAYRKTTFL